MPSLVRLLESRPSRKPKTRPADDATVADVQEFFERVGFLAGTDPAAAARLAAHWEVFAKADRATALRAKAVGERAKGHWLRSDETLRAASRAAGDPVRALEYAIGRVDSLARAGRPYEAAKLGRRIASALDRHDKPRSAARARLNTANALLWSDRYGEAVRELTLAIPHLEGAEAASANLALSTAEMFGGSASEAHRLARIAESALAELGLDHYARMAQVNQGYALAMLGRAEEGLAILRSEGGLEEDARTAELLGDVYRQCGLHQESVHAYEVALRNARGLNRADVNLGLGIAHADAGRWKAADQRFQLAANAFRRLKNRPWLAYALAKSALSRLEQSNGAQGLAALRRATAQLEKAKSARLYADCILDLAEWEAKLGCLSQDRVRECRSAMVGLGGLGDQWRLLAAEAEALRGERRTRRLGAALDDLARGRDRLASPLLRAAFMRNRTGLLGRFVASVADDGAQAGLAMAQVRKHRALGLMEDISSSYQGAIPADLSSTVERLRDALGAASGTDARRGSVEPSLRQSLQTEWSEAHLSIRQAAGHLLESAPAPDLVWVESDDTTFLLADGTVRSLPFGKVETTRRLRALRFEIAGAVLEGGANIREAEARIRDLAWLLPDGAQGQSFGPEGQLWQVPWAALTEPGQEPLLALAPIAPPLSRALPESPRVLLWTSDWDDLPHLREEVELVLGAFPDATVCQTAAEAQESLQGGDYDLLHVATHAQAHSGSPLFSWAAFPDGRIHAFEVLGSQASLGAVVLTACEAAAVSAANPFEPEGLGRAFLSRGASVVVGPIWPLDDQSAKMFVEHLYKSVSDGGDWAVAIGLAREKVRERMPHPYYWAPFATLRGYR